MLQCVVENEQLVFLPIVRSVANSDVDILASNVIDVV